MANNDGQIVLGLDIPKTVAQINGDIKKLEKQLEQVKATGALDTSETVKQINSQISALQGKLQEINIQANVNVNNNTAKKAQQSAQQLGQKIGDTVEKSVQQSLSIDDVIDKQVTDLMAKYSIAGKKGSKAFEEIRQAVVNYRKELASIDSAFDSDDIFDIFSNSADIRKVTSALTDHMKVADATKDTYASLAEYIKHVNNSGTKIHLPESIRQEYGDDFSSMRSQLGKAFTTGQGGDFESFITELNGDLGNVIDMSQGAEAAFGDLVQKVNSAKGGNFLSGDELFKQGYLDRNEIERDITSAIDIIEEEEKKLAQTSTAVANAVVQNEQKKQQAYQQTANTQKKVAESESIIKKNANVTTFAQSNNAARIARDEFEQLLKAENAVISVTERFGKNNNLTSFSLNIKRATGEVETLRYALENIGDNKNPIYVFKNNGAELNNAGAIKQIQAIENAFTDYTQKFAQFKSTNTNILSGLTVPLQDFESKLAGLKNGTATIDEVKNSFKLLGTEASKVTANFTGQLSKTDAAIRKLSQGDEIMDGLKASFKGLSNAPKDINTELNKVSKLLREVRNIESQEGRTANWSAKYREWSDEVDRLKAKLTVLQKQQASMTTPQIFKTSDLRNADIPYMTKVSNTIEKQMVEIQKMANAKGWQNFEVKGIEKADGQIKSLTLTVREADGALKQFQMQRAKLQGSGKAQTGLMQVGDVKVIETASQAQAKLAQQTENANAKLQEQVNKIQLSFDDGTYEAKYDSLIAKTRQWINANDESVISTQRLTTAYNEFNQAATAYAKDGSVANRDKLIQKEEELARQIKATTNEVKSYNAEYAKSSKIDSLHQKIQEFYDKNTATHRKWGAQLKNMLNETAHGAQLTATRVNEIEQEFLGVGNAARQAGKLGDSFFGGIKKQAGQFLQWFSVTSVIMEGVQQVRKMVNEVKTLDNAMMDLTMATRYNKSQIEDLMDTYFKLGDKLSATASDVAASADTWLRQGKSIAETNKLIEDSMVLSKIGGLSSEDSTKYLTSVMKGYKVATEDVIGVVDKLSAVDMASATDVGGLAEGMSEVAASADLAGVSMDKLLGYLATIGEVTQSGMSEVGTTLNAVFARMGNIKLSRLKDYETGEDLSNVETVLRGVGINLRDSMNSFRDFDEVLDETASNWNNYSEVQQRAIAQAFSGTHHMNEFIILMENYDTALKYTETSLGSTGQAMEKFEAYEESIAGHTEKFKNAFQDLSNSVIDSGLINFFIDLGTTGIKAVDGLVDALGGLGAIGLGAGLFAGFKNAGREKCYPSY